MNVFFSPVRSTEYYMPIILNALSSVLAIASDKYGNVGFFSFGIRSPLRDHRAPIAFALFPYLADCHGL